MRLIFAFILAWTASASATFAIPSKYWDEYSTGERQDALIQETIVQKHRRFRRDCSGYVEAVLMDLGHDLGQFVQSYDVHTNGVSQIYQYVQRSGTIYKDELPKPGDLIFFSNTYDMNRDGKSNDGLSHIGIVVSIDRDETIAFRHVVQKKIQTDYINFTKPTLHTYDGKIINSYLRRTSKKSTYPALASQLFDFFGSLSP